MKVTIEAFRNTNVGEKMVITKRVIRMSNLEEVVRRLREAAKVWERGPKKKIESPPQGSP